MSLDFANTVIDCTDPNRVGEFWAALLVRPLGGPDDAGDRWIEVDDQGLEIIFVTVPEGKSGKNRVHIDLRPDDQDAEVERALALGARHVDIGQSGVPWVVLADPEGNEFCILSPRRVASS